MEFERVQSPASDESMGDTDQTLTRTCSKVPSPLAADGLATPLSSKDDTGESDWRKAIHVYPTYTHVDSDPADPCEVLAVTDIVFQEPLGNRSTPLKPAAPKIPKTLQRVRRRHFVSTSPVVAGTAAILRYQHTPPHAPMEFERVQSPASDESMGDTDQTLTRTCSKVPSPLAADGLATPLSSKDDTGESDWRKAIHVYPTYTHVDSDPADPCEVLAVTDIVFQEPLGNRSTPLKPSAPKIPKTLQRPACVRRRHFVSPGGGGMWWSNPKVTPLKASAPKIPKTLERPACVRRRHFVSPEGGGMWRSDPKVK